MISTAKIRLRFAHTKTNKEIFLYLKPFLILRIGRRTCPNSFYCNVAFSLLDTSLHLLCE